VIEEESSKKEWDMHSFLGYDTIREVSGDFQVDLQDQACCRWNHRDVQSLIFVLRILPTRGRILGRDTFSSSQNKST
jgi:hypothetical protein